ATNLAIGMATGLMGRFGTAAIAGYGTGSRLEYLLVPLVFGLGGPLVAIVGTNIGAGRLERALQAAWIGAAIAAGLCEAIGLFAALAPTTWLGLFDNNTAMLEAGSRYLQLVGPFYGLFGVGLALYFASQGAGRLAWPLAANLVRLLVAAGGGWLVMRLGGGISEVLAVQGIALAAFGLISAAAVAGGAWFPDTDRSSWRLARSFLVGLRQWNGDRPQHLPATQALASWRAARRNRARTTIICKG